MKRVFFVVGPTAIGKSEIAAETAQKVDAEIVNADAFQIYCGLDLLTAKPNAATLAKSPHHLIGTLPLTEELNAQRFCELAQKTLREIAQRGKPALVVGGSGLYLKALMQGLDPLPGADADLRAQLNQLDVNELYARLQKVDPETASQIDRQNSRRLVRALEICLLTGKPVSAQRHEKEKPLASLPGIFVFRERDEMYKRIDRRVEEMFANGVTAEVENLGVLGSTAKKALGLGEIRQMLADEISREECIAKIQQATRRYAKRQLTWFRGQTTFPSLNLSLHISAGAIESISREALLSFASTE